MAHGINTHSANSKKADALLGGGTAVAVAGTALNLTAGDNATMTTAGMIIFLVGAAIIIAGLIVRNKYR